jgi:serine/threonine protein kinase/tetratricopeptide (TPR) repeat protein
MEDPKKTGGRQNTGAGGPQGVGVPAKGDSSASNAPSDPADSATISDAPLTPPATLSKRIVNPDLTLSDSMPGTRAPNRSLSGTYMREAVLNPGDVIGGRYEILQLLGEGGMGAVYKALDHEVERTVALKLIRPELASNPSILARFKQELLTAHQVTHKNVIRIYDISEADGVKFITMEFIEGSDLRHILIDNGKLTPERAIEIIRQVCLALDAAHSVGIIHRDLKPQNIMQESKSGRILVMDFGLARSVESEGMTQTGALLGTIEYMSPEQAMGKQLDGRSDLFSVGLIFYELLTCNTPFKADTAMASLLKRNQERALPAAELDASIPKGLSDIVSKCLERDLNLRYQSAQEILADLDAWQGKRPISASVAMQIPVPKRAVPWKWISAGTLAVAVAIGGWALSGKLTSKRASKAVAGPEVSLAILPFRNGSGDAGLDWLGPSLADMLSTDVGQSAHLHTISPERLHQVLSDLRITQGSAIDPTMVGRIAEFSSADTVVWGQYAKFGEQIRIDATLLDLKHNRRAPLKIEAASEKEIPRTVDGLAELIRKNLAVSPDVLKELKTSSFQPTSKSVPALRAYNQGVQLLREGKNLDALKYFQNSTKDDAEFALAFSKMADAYSRLGYDIEAEHSASKAVELSENLPTAEKYLIAANHFRIAKDYPKAIEVYQNLAKVSPDNPDIEAALGFIYENSGDFVKAREFYQKLLAANPKDITTLLAIGRVEILSGNPQASLDPLNRALSLAIQVDNQEQKGTILHALGIAYSSLNKPDDALQNYKQALEIRRRLGQKKGIADGLSMMAQTYDGLGKSDLALKNYNDALQLYREIGDQQDTGDILLDLGQFHNDRGRYDEALKLFKESLQIQRDLHNPNNEALCLNNIGNSYLSKSDYDDARIYFEQALTLREKINVPSDIALTVHNLAEVSAKTGQYEQSLAHHMRALDLYRSAGDKHGAAMEAYTMGTVFEYQGRYGSAVSSKRQAVQDFRDTQDRSFWMAEALSGYGNALSEAGQFDEGSKTLDDALKLSRELKNDAQVAQALNWQGDNSFYRGDLKSAKSLYEQALHTASKKADRNLLLVSTLNSSKADIAGGRAQSALSTLKGVSDDADSLGLKYLSIECAIYEAEARIQLKEYPRAQQQLERAALQSENLGLRPLRLRAHFSLGKMFRERGAPADAASHYGQALSLLDSLRKEPGADKIMERADFKAIYDESDRWVRERR